MRLGLSLFVLLFLTGSAFAQSGKLTSSDIAAGVFSAVERRAILDYYSAAPVPDRRDDEGGHGKGHGKHGKDGLPPGLAKKASLPPGLAKKRELPPGLAKRDLPPDLLMRLPDPRPGQQRIIVDSNVLLVDIATGIVLDILQDVVTR